MAVSRGEPWGAPGKLAEGAPVASSDCELARLAHDGATLIGVTDGDIWRAVGAPAGGRARLASPSAHRAPIDLLSVTANGRTLLAAAHVTARPPWRRGGWLAGDAVIVANGEWCGNWKVAPPAHPNDGWAHVTTIDGPALEGTGLEGAGHKGVSFPVRQRLTARRLARSGDHLPHPAISARRARSTRHTFASPHVLVVDGRRRGTVSSLTVEVVPDAVEIVF